MKTERFDDEFRRKLLGLPANTDPGEIDRIQAYVQTHGLSAPGFVWGKLLFVGGAGLLLVTSLTYNILQSYRNTHLQAALDSLGPRSRPIANHIQHATVYLIRQAAGPAKGRDSLSTMAAQSAGHEPAERALTAAFGRNSASAVSKWQRVNENRGDSLVNGYTHHSAQIGQWANGPNCLPKRIRPP